jgi:hypothetical protein
MSVLVFEILYCVSLYIMTTASVSNFLINSSNYRQGSSNQFRYVPKKTLPITNNHSIAINSCSIYNSFFNIKASWGNNKIILLSDKLITANVPLSTGVAVGTNYTDPISGVTINKPYISLTLPDGYFDIQSIDDWLQNRCQLIGLYLQSSDGSSNSYFIEALTNPQVYKCQINLYLLPQTAPPSGYLVPNGACFSLTGVPSTLQVYFPSVASSSKYGNLGRIFGFVPETILPLSNNILAKSDNISVVTPVVSPITTVLIGCNLVQNEYSNPEDILTQLNLGDSKFGGIIKYDQQPIYVTCQPQQASYIQISLYDEYMTPLDMNDTQVSIVLSIKEELIRKAK